MNTVIDILSGEVPGGILLFVLILFVINLILFFFYKGSKFFTKQQYKNKVYKSNSIIFVLYITAWILLKPPTLPDSIVFLPVQDSQEVDYEFCELIEKNIRKQLSNDYRLYPWQWLIETCDQDSISNYIYRLNLAKRLNINLIIAGKIKDTSKILMTANKLKNQISKEFEYTSLTDLNSKVLNWLNTNFDILKDSEDSLVAIQKNQLNKIIKAKLLYLNSDYDKSLQIIQNLQPEPVVLKSKIYLELGIHEQKNIKKTEFGKTPNKYFDKIRSLIIPIARQEQDTDEMNRILGCMYLFEDKYKESEIFLKKALTQNPYNARIYGDMYYLHEDRYRELGFDNRFELLKFAIKLDPGYSNAVFNLANDYFQTGTGIKSGSGTTLALQVLNEYMGINNKHKKIMTLLASINLQIKHTDEAIKIYKRLIELGYTDGEIYYNIGIGYFHKREFEKAEKFFLKSIELNNYPDSFLYLGAINKIIGNYDKAKYYYRERIKRSKQGEDDYYAKEALHGLQWILNKQHKDSVTNKSGTKNM